MIELNLNPGRLAPVEPASLRERLHRWLAPGRRTAGVPDAWAECRVDADARLAWRDPVQYRREQLPSGSRARAVLDEAARRSDWSGALPPGTARGVAMGEVAGSWATVVAEVSDGPDGPRVHRLVVAAEGRPDDAAAGRRQQLQRVLLDALRHDVTDADVPPASVWWVGWEGVGAAADAAARAAVRPAMANALNALAADRARAQALAADAG